MSETEIVPQPVEGKCNARLRGERAGQLCADDPIAGRTRCRAHGGLSPQAAAHPRTTHGMRSKGTAAPEMFSEPFGDEELKLVARFHREPEDALRLQLAEGAVVQRRALRVGNVDAYARLGTMIASTARALVSLREVPPPDRGLPTIVHYFEGKTASDFDHDLEILRHEAEVAVS